MSAGPICMADYFDISLMKSDRLRNCVTADEIVRLLIGASLERDPSPNDALINSGLVPQLSVEF